MLNDWWRKNLIYIIFGVIVLALSILYCFVNEIDIIYIITHPTPQFITAVVILLLVSIMFVSIFWKLIKKD